VEGFASIPVAVRGRLWCAGVAALASLLVALGLAGSASGKGRTTLVVGYVSAGAPVNGARLSVYTADGRRLRLQEKRPTPKSDADGFFVLVLPGRPGLVRLVASGGSVSGGKVNGSLEAILPHPGPARDVFVNPVSTVIAAYASRHPRASLARATREGRRLLALGPGDSIGRALLHVTPYFDGLSFLRAARAHGGLRRYVASVTGRSRPVSFRAQHLLGGFEDYVKLLTTAKNAVSAVQSIGSFAYDIFKWAQGPEKTTGEIWEAVQQMKQQLEAIQTSLANIHNEIYGGFQKVLDIIKKEAYARRAGELKQLASTVASTEDDFQDLVDNATSPDFKPSIAADKTREIKDNIKTIKDGFQQINDVFRDGVMKGETIPAYYYKGQVLLAQSAHFMTPADSAQLRNFASFVLDYQALAFNLIVRYETSESGSSPNSSLLHALKLYLGFSSNEANAWLAASAKSGVPSPPPTGDLRDELDYLATIAPVPAHTVVEADGLDNLRGPMWQAGAATPIDLGRDIYARHGGMGCADRYHPPYSQLGKNWCQYMWKGWVTAQNDLAAAENPLGASLSGWKPATSDQALTLFKRDNIASVLQTKPDYWDPSAFKLRIHKYNVTEDDRYADYYTGYADNWVDGVDVTTFKALPEDHRVTTGSCFFGVGDSKGTNCPALYALLQRTPDVSEHYWPSES
jgi:hypothetical protein